MFQITARRGKSLKRLRADSRIDQRELASRLGIDSAQLSRIENEVGGFGLPRGFGWRYQEELLELVLERGNRGP